MSKNYPALFYGVFSTSCKITQVYDSYKSKLITKISEIIFELTDSLEVSENNHLRKLLAQSSRTVFSCWNLFSVEDFFHSSFSDASNLTTLKIA